MRILLIPPVGDTPWASQKSVVDALREEGNEVVVADTVGDFPHPPEYRPKLGHPESTARFAARRFVGYARFLRQLRRHLVDGEYDLVLTWTSFWALLSRAVRPRSTRVAWVLSERTVTRRTHGMLRSAAASVVDTVVVADQRLTLANFGRQTPALPIDEPVDADVTAVAAHSWVVFGGQRLPDAVTLALITAERGRAAAAAVVLNGRGADGAIAVNDERLQAACGAPALDLAFDAGWIERHAPAFIIDPIARLDRLDHRHRAAFQAGIPIRVPRSVVIGPVAHHVEAIPAGDWVELRPLQRSKRDARAWARDAVRDPLNPRWEFVKRNGLPVLKCPACASAERSVVSKVQRVTTIYQCDSCGLRYGSPKVPDDLVYEIGYHDGTGLFGANYAESAWYFDALSDGRLDFIESAGVTPSSGSMIDLGTGLGHFVRQARARGWDADGLEVSAEAVAIAQRDFDLDLHVGEIASFSPTQKYGLATLGQTLEHFVNPGDVLNHIRENVLVRGGALYIELPHVDGLPRRLRGKAWDHWQSGDHVSFFTRPLLEGLLDRAGFDVVCCETVSFPAPGSIGVLYTLGIFDHRSSLGIALIVCVRTARRFVPFLRRRSIVPAGTAAAAAQRTRTERVLLGAARAVDRAGFGDHIRVVARAR